MRVLIPFGARKIYEVGYVVNLKESSEYKCKNIVKIIDRVFDEKKLMLAKWISEKYFCTLADAIRLLVPPGTTTNVEKVKANTEKYLQMSFFPYILSNLTQLSQPVIHTGLSYWGT